VAARPRTPWEAADLGLALLRAQAGPVARVWLTLLLPLALVLAVLCRDSPWLAPLVIWWLKPALDRPVLHVLAKATFVDPPSLAGTLRGLPGYCRRGLVASLLWQRFQLERSLLLPVWQLEEPSLGAFRRRRKVLFRRGRTQAQLLCCVCLLFNLVLAAGVLAGLAYFHPGGGGQDLLAAVFARSGHRIAWLDILLCFLPTLTTAVVEPVYVAAGFGLYLNRRVQLEGWDLEQAFRQLGQRARGRAAQGLMLAALLAFGLGLRAQAPPMQAAQAPPMQAAQAPPMQAAQAPVAQAAPSSPAKAALAEVLKSPEFSTRRQTWRLRARRPSAPAAPAPPPAWIGLVLDRLAFLLKWLIPAALVIWLGLTVWRHRAGLALALAPLPPPEAILGLDIRPDGLPADLPQAAARLWDQGDRRGALSLLYRGALAHLVHGMGLPLGAGSTEGECLRLGGPRLPAEGAEYFTRLTEAWLKVAYGGLPADDADRDLCADWAGHFRPAREFP
jgi:hypothetical protein